MRGVQRISALLVACLLLAAVGGSAMAQETAVIRLGLLASADTPAGRGAQLAIAEINGSGGITGPDGTVYAIELLSTPVRTADEVRAGLAALAERDVIAILGPDNNAVILATFNDLRALRLPVFTAATNDALTIADTADYIFRIRAPERVYAQAVAQYLIDTFPQPVIVPVQAGTDSAATEGLAVFTAALNSSDVAPAETVQINEPDDLSPALNAVLGLNPAAVGVWGDPTVAADLLRALRESGWAGAYFYRDATGEDFRAELDGGTANGVLSVTNWTPGVRSAASDRFLRTYVVTFSSVPDGLSAAYYDAIYLLAAAVSEVGAEPAAIQGALRDLEDQTGVQGPLEPGRFRTGETVTAAGVVELNIYASPQLRAMFVDGEQVAGQEAGQGAAILPTSSPAPTLPATLAIPATSAATATPTQSPTPEGAYGTVNAAMLNVRSGPGTNYDIIGQLQLGETVYPIGSSGDFNWLVIPFRGTNGWIATFLVDLQGNTSALPVIAPPPSPTPLATATPTPTPIPQLADLAIITASLDPARPTIGQPFNVRVIVRNNGNVISAETALAATFEPDDVYVSASVPPLAAGQSTEVILRPTINASGAYTIQLVVDLNNLVSEGPAGESNNLYPLTYALDRAVYATGTFSLGPGQEHDLDGSGATDIRWDGSNLLAVNGASIAVLPGVNWFTVHYDQLSGVTGSTIPRVSLTPGITVGLTAAPGGRRGALRVEGFNADIISYSYRVYGL